MVVIFGSEQLTSGKMKESTKTMGKDTNGGYGLVQEGQTTTVLQSSQARHYSVAYTQLFMSVTRDYIAWMLDKYLQKCLYYICSKTLPQNNKNSFNGKTASELFVLSVCPDEASHYTFVPPNLNDPAFL